MKNNNIIIILMIAIILIEISIITTILFLNLNNQNTSKIKEDNSTNNNIVDNNISEKNKYKTIKDINNIENGASAEELSIYTTNDNDNIVILKIFNKTDKKIYSFNAQITFYDKNNKEIDNIVQRITSITPGQSEQISFEMPKSILKTSSYSIKKIESDE